MSRASNDQPAGLNSCSVPTGALVACPVCDAPPDRQRVLFSKQGVTFRRCAPCRFELVNPRPTAEWLVRHYDRLGAEYFLDSRKVESDFWPNRYDVELLLLTGLSGTLLDVGCATGSFVKLALDAGFDASGIDLMAPAVAFGREEFGLPLSLADFTDGQVPSDSVSVVTLWATLEHLSEPSRFLEEAWRVLRPDGALAVSVPNHRSLTQRVLGPKNRYVCVEHLNYFSPRTLRLLLEKFGFEVDSVLTRKVNPKTVLEDMRRRTLDVTPVEQLIDDQMATDSLKTRPLFAPVRVIHAFVERSLGVAGLGDLLLVRGRKRALPDRD